MSAHNNKCCTIFYNRWINRLWTDRLGDWFLDICSLKSVVYCLKELNKYHVNWEIQVLELSKLLYEKYDIGKIWFYTFCRLLEKGAITR